MLMQELIHKIIYVLVFLRLKVKVMSRSLLYCLLPTKFSPQTRGFHLHNIKPVISPKRNLCSRFSFLFVSVGREVQLSIFQNSGNKHKKMTWKIIQLFGTYVICKNWPF